jgi:hypothetical protein
MAHTAELPFGDDAAVRLAALLLAERARLRTWKVSRALSIWTQALFVLRWSSDGTRVKQLCWNSLISEFVGDRYLTRVLGRRPRRALICATRRWQRAALSA